MHHKILALLHFCKDRELGQWGFIEAYLQVTHLIVLTVSTYKAIVRNTGLLGGPGHVPLRFLVFQVAWCCLVFLGREAQGFTAHCRVWGWIRDLVILHGITYWLEASHRDAAQVDTRVCIGKITLFTLIGQVQVFGRWRFHILHALEAYRNWSPTIRPCLKCVMPRDFPRVTIKGTFEFCAPSPNRVRSGASLQAANLHRSGVVVKLNTFSLIFGNLPKLRRNLGERCHISLDWQLCFWRTGTSNIGLTFFIWTIVLIYVPSVTFKRPLAASILSLGGTWVIVIIKTLR